MGAEADADEHCAAPNCQTCLDRRSQLTAMQRADALYPDAMQWFEWSLPFHAQHAIRLDVKDQPSGYHGRSLKKKYPRGLRAQIPKELHDAWRTYQGLEPRPGTLMVHLYTNNPAESALALSGGAMMTRTGRLCGPLPAGTRAAITVLDVCDSLEVEIRHTDTWCHKLIIPIDLCGVRISRVTVRGPGIFYMETFNDLADPPRKAKAKLEEVQAARWLEPDAIARSSNERGRSDAPALSPERLAASRGIWRRFVANVVTTPHRSAPRRFDREVAAARRFDVYSAVLLRFERFTAIAGGSWFDPPVTPARYPDVWRQVVDLEIMTVTCKCCGKTYEGCQATGSEWSTLRLVGVQTLDADAFGPAVAYELRDCACGSTLSVELPADREDSARSSEANS